jgi:hypothetical protein
MKFEDYGLDGEMLAKAQKDYDADILGLKNKNTDLIERERIAKADLEQSKLDTEQVKHDLAKELATEKGSVADYKLALDAEKEAITLLKLSFQGEKDDRTLSDAVNDFSGGLVDDPAGKMYMQSLFKNSVEVKEGLIVSKDVTKSVDELKLSLVTDKANAKYIKANVGSGLGSAGSDGGDSSANDTKNTKAEAASKSGDTLGFIQASLNQ